MFRGCKSLTLTNKITFTVAKDCNTYDMCYYCDGKLKEKNGKDDTIIIETAK